MSLPFLHTGGHCRWCKYYNGAIIPSAIVEMGVPFCDRHYLEIVLGVKISKKLSAKKIGAKWREKRKKKRLDRKQEA